MCALQRRLQDKATQIRTGFTGILPCKRVAIGVAKDPLHLCCLQQRRVRSWAHEISFIKPFGEIILSMQDVLHQLFAPFPSALLSCEASEVGSCSLVPLWAITALLKSLTEADRNAVLADLTLVNQLTFTSNSQLYLASCWHRWKQSMWFLVIS